MASLHWSVFSDGGKRGLISILLIMQYFTPPPQLILGRNQLYEAEKAVTSSLFSNLWYFIWDNPKAEW
jgi:hypothetical protein